MRSLLILLLGGLVAFSAVPVQAADEAAPRQRGRVTKEKERNVRKYNKRW